MWWLLLAATPEVLPIEYVEVDLDEHRARRIGAELSWQIEGIAGRLTVMPGDICGRGFIRCSPDRGPNPRPGIEVALVERPAHIDITVTYRRSASAPRIASAMLPRDPDGWPEVLARLVHTLFGPELPPRARSSPAP